VDRREFLLAGVAGALGLALPGRTSAGGIPSGPLALVTADLDAHVAAVDLADGRILGRIPTIWGPRSIESIDATTALVAHTELGRLSFVDVGDFRVRRVLLGIREPRYAAARRGLAYVTDSARGEVATVDARRGSIVARTAVPGPARHVTLTPDGDAIWTALGSKASRIAVIDARDARQPRLARLLTPPFLAHDVVAAPDGSHVWVTSGDSPRLAVYDRRGRKPLELISAGAPPQHIAFVGGLAFVASGDEGTVRVHRQDGTLVREARVPLGSYNVCFGGSRAVTPSLARGTVALLDRQGRVRATRRIARAAHDACVLTGI
jgi:DNA-binding beta-propeller fold protein YncE